MSPILPFAYSPIFLEGYGSGIYFASGYGGDVEYDSYQPYGLTTGDWDWFHWDQRVFGAWEFGTFEQMAADWAENQGLISQIDGIWTLTALESILEEQEDHDLSDPETFRDLFGFNPSDDASVTLRIDPLLGLSEDGQFLSQGQWYQGGHVVETLESSLGELAFSSTGVSLSGFVVNSALSGLAESEKIDLGQNMWGIFQPAGMPNSFYSSHVGAIAVELAPEDEDARANIVDAVSAPDTYFGLNVSLGDFAPSEDAPEFIYSLVEDAGGAFAIDSETGQVVVADSGALAAIAGTSPTITVRVSTVHGHRDTDFTVTVSGAASYNPVTGTAAGETLTGTSSHDSITGEGGDDLLEGGDGNDWLYGGTGVNVLEGGSGNDLVIGGSGDDTMAGGAGNDLLAGNGGANLIRFDLGDGSDIIRANSIGLTEAANATTIEFGLDIDPQELELHQSADGQDLIVEIGTGGDMVTVEGLLGDPDQFGTITFVFADSTSWTIEDIARKVVASAVVRWDGQAISSQPAILLGSSVGDTLTGGLGGDFIWSGDDADIVDGGAGADRMTGGGGSDLYFVDDGADVVVEEADGGLDEVRTSLSSFTAPAEVEAITYTGTGNFTVLGNASDNIFTGGAGADEFTGGAGDDLYYVGQATDVVVEAAGEGWDEIRTDLASHSLAANVEGLTYTGAGDFTGTGNAENNLLRGGDGNDILDGGAGNDELAGGGGADAMIGGAGSDFYEVDDAADTVTELSGGGDDTVATSLSEYALGDHLENLEYAGNDSFTGLGNDLDNRISGGRWEDRLSGGAGADVMAGGFGDDAYEVDDAGDVVSEVANAGWDMIETTIDRVLDANVEDMVFVGTGAFTGTGNALSNYIAGGDSDDTLSGGAGDDQLDGGLGADVMAGGVGDDTYYVDDVGDGVTEAAGEGVDTVETSLGTYELGANLENLVSTGEGDFEGTGNVLDNQITGGLGNNFLIGGLGDDTYFINSDTTTIVEQSGEGTDHVVSRIEEVELAANVENLTYEWWVVAAHGVGNTLDNILTGSFSASYLEGGAGDDIYCVFSEDDQIVELDGRGDDEVRVCDGFYETASFILQENVERLTYVGSLDFAGTGNSLENVLTGSIGDDLLDGGEGADTLAGGTGNDLYRVDNAGDVIVEAADEGVDIVETSLNTYTLQANLEGVTFTGSGDFEGTGGGGDDRLTGGDGDDRLASGNGNDRLDGGKGADLLEGGAGDDHYLVDDAQDEVVEASGGGIDTVTTWLDFALGSEVENLRYAGSDDFTGIGNALDNQIFGGGGDDLLDGGGGNDLMVGGFGDDIFYVDSSGDEVVELMRQGTDEVRTTLASYTLAEALDDLTFVGTGAFSGTGNADDNVLTGGVGNDSLAGGAGHDELDGRAGIDTLAGGDGNDTYHVGDADDVIVEAVDAGTDTVTTALSSWTLAANLENLSSTGASGFTGIGNELANLIKSSNGDDLISGGDGDDRIETYSGNDEIDGGDGADTVLAGDGDDNVIGGAGNDTIWANAGSDTIHGGDGDDHLDGGWDFDTVYGGAGNDVYEVDEFNDLVIENAGEGTDLVVTSSSTYSLTANVENLTLTYWGLAFAWGNELSNVITGSFSSNGISGMAGDDQLFGAEGNDTLSGNEGDDSLDGGVGNDRMEFGAGDDEASDAAGDDTYVYNPGDGNDIIYDWGGADVLELGVGIDSSDVTVTLLEEETPGDGDSYVLTFAGVPGSVTIWAGAESDRAIEEVRFADGTVWTPADLEAASNVPVNQAPIAETPIGPLVGSEDTLLDTALPAGSFVDPDGDALSITAMLADGSPLPSWLSFDGTRFTGTPLGNFHGSLALTLTASDGALTTEAPLELTIAAVNDAPVLQQPIADAIWRKLVAEQLTLSPATFADIDGDSLTITAELSDGSALPAWLTFDPVTHTFSGVAPSGTAPFAIRVTASDGQASASDLFTLRIAANTITGTSGGEVLTGTSGTDALYGLAGNDRLKGGAGADLLDGGAGFDWADYTSSAVAIVFDFYDGSRTTGDAVGDIYVGIESYVGSSYSDTFIAGATATTFDGGTSIFTTPDTVDYSLSTSAIALTLTTTSSNQLVQGSGVGGLAAGDGFYSIERFIGTSFGDVYTVTGASSISPVFVEAANGGIDEVRTDFSTYVLGSQVENLTYVGTGGNFNGIGNSLDNVITGGAGNDRLKGGAGADTLIGGTGFDWADYSGAATAIVLDFYDGSRTTGHAVGDIYVGIESYIGTSFADTFIAGATATTFDGGASAFSDADTVDFSLSTSAIALTLATSAANELVQGSGAGGLAAGDGIYSIERFIGTSFDDVYTITGATSVSVAFVEAANGGVDEVRTDYSTYVLGSQIENLTYIGVGNFNGIGNSLDNVITGGVGNDRLKGGAGADTLIGGTGFDWADYSGAATAIVLDFYDGSRTTGHAVGDTYVGIESYIGTSFADTFIAGATATTFDGGASAFSDPDTVDFSLSTLAIALTLATSAANQLVQGSGAGGLAAGDGIYSIERFIGTSYDDVYTITGASSVSVTFVEAAGGGVDEVRTDYSTYVLGSHIENLTYIGSGNINGFGNSLDNVLTGAASNDRLTGGAGDDTVIGGAGVDVAVFAGVQADYSIVTSGGTIQIVDNQPTVDGNDGTDTVLGMEKAEFKGGVQVSLAAPIVLDLDGDGIELREKGDAPIGFDWDGDGILDRSGWVGSGDGLLTLDRDGNGTVSGGDELSFVDDKPGARSDFDGLTVFDSDGDGRLSAADSSWYDFHVWRDADGDGLVGEGEYLSLAEAGIASIGLSATATSRSWDWGANIIVNNGSYDRTDGTSGELADVALSYDAAPGQEPATREATAQIGERLEFPRELWTDVWVAGQELTPGGDNIFGSEDVSPSFAAASNLAAAFEPEQAGDSGTVPGEYQLWFNPLLSPPVLDNWIG